MNLLEPMFVEHFPGGVQSLTRASADLIPTLSLGFRRTAAETVTHLPRTTATRVIAGCAGSGLATVGDQRFSWRTGDVFAVPCRIPVRIATDEPSYLFEASGEATRRRLGLLLEETEQ